MNVDSDSGSGSVSGSHSPHSRGSRTSSYIDYFDLSDDKFPWRDSRPQEIEHRRALLTDALIFDELLRAGGIHEPDVLYPPRDVSSLERLLDTIEGCQFDVVKKECLVYYLLKWYDDDRATQYRKLRGLLPQYRAMVDAYFALDTGVDVAVRDFALPHSRGSILIYSHRKPYQFSQIQGLLLITRQKSFLLSGKNPIRHVSCCNMFAAQSLLSRSLTTWNYIPLLSQRIIS